jgi:uncharacterized protein YjbJ (UPF0337 family)
MGEKIDKAKGHAKEAAGDLTGNKDLEREGKMDQTGGAVKGAAERAKDKVDEGVDAAKRHANDH